MPSPANAATPLLSVLIPALNEAGNITGCVASALALAPGWSGPVEAIVADGGSRDDTIAQAVRAGARTTEASQGRGRQLAAAASAARGDVLLMLHADCRIDPGAGAQLREATQSRGVRLGAFRQRIDARGAGYRLIERGNRIRACWLGLPYGDQAIFLGRELLESLGGVPDLPLMEDVALMQRARRQAWPTVLPGPVVVSARRWRSGGVVRQTLRNWALLAAFLAGVPVERIAKHYRPHAD